MTLLQRQYQLVNRHRINQSYLQMDSIKNVSKNGLQRTFFFNATKRSRGQQYRLDATSQPNKIHSKSTTPKNFTTTSKSNKRNNNNHSQSQSSSSPPSSFENFILTLTSRIISGFGILHILSEYCFEMTRCEGPSMMPTIQPNGEIIFIEKITHRLYGLDGGDNADSRAAAAREKQLEWEKVESRLWLAGKHRQSSNSDSSSSKMKKEDIDMVHTWYESRLKEASSCNYKELSSWSECWNKLTTGICVGDVVVIQHPNKDGTVCKRVLGLPGDIILRPKENSQTFSRYYSRFRQRGGGRESHREVRNMFHSDEEKGESSQDNNNAFQAFADTSKPPPLHNSSLIIVPSGHIWLEGDNSINSADSKNYGPVPASLVVGKVWMRLWPLWGNSVIVRGGCPVPPSQVRFIGSTQLPAGYEGESLVIDKGNTQYS